MSFWKTIGNVAGDIGKFALPVLGTAAGEAFGGPMGAMLGGNLGGAIGNSIGGHGGNSQSKPPSPSSSFAGQMYNTPFNGYGNAMSGYAQNQFGNAFPGMGNMSFGDMAHQGLDQLGNYLGNKFGMSGAQNSTPNQMFQGFGNEMQNQMNSYIPQGMGNMSPHQMNPYIPQGAGNMSPYGMAGSSPYQNPGENLRGAFTQHLTNRIASPRQVPGQNSAPNMFAY